MRRTVLAVVGLAAATVLTPVPSPASPVVDTAVERGAAARISLSAPSEVTPGSVVVLTGKTTARRGARVQIFQQRVGNSRWTLEGKTRVKRRGKFRYSESVTSFDRYYKACVGRSCSGKRLVRVRAQQPPPPPQPQPTSLALTAGPAAQIEAGQSITVSGTASPNLVGKAVVLQSYDAASESWGAVGSASVDAASAWSVSGALGTAGRSVPVRVVAPATPTTQESSVAAGNVAVFGWYYFGDAGAPQGVTNNYSDYDPIAVNGVSYGHSIWFSRYTTSMSDEWNISRSCTRFAATVGLDDDSPTTARYATQVYSDAVSKWSKGDIALGQAHPLDIDISNGLRLKIAVQRTSGDYANLAFADARALCAF